MKAKIPLVLAMSAFLVSNLTLNAQTNTFPATGNVGIGTAAPTSKLDILPANGNALTIRPYGTAANNTGQLQFKELSANGNNHIAFRAPDALASNYIFRLPINYGTNGQLLTTNGAGVLSWTTIAGGGGATTSLNNLVTTSINQNLVPSADNTRDLGTSAKGWRNIYASGSYFIDGSPVIKVEGTTTQVGLTHNTSNTGNVNTFVGESAGNINSSGFQNTVTGAFSLSHNTTGHSNVALGAYSSTFSNGSANTATGYVTLQTTLNSNYNVAYGAGAGSLYDNGWNNTFVGANSDVAGSGYYNVIALGNAAKVYAPNEAVIGNTVTNSIGGYANWSNFSDGRYKKDVKENVKGLEFIMKLRPVTYHLDVTGLSERANESRGQQQCEQMITARAEKEKMVQTGFIAQEVEAAAKELNFDFSGVDAPQSENDLYALRYAEFVVPLVKAVQELNEALKMQNAELKSANAALKNKISQIHSVLSQEQQQRLSELQNTKSILEQNIPNPFNRSTVIKYFIPENFGNAQLKIYSSQGVEMKAYAIKQSGKGELTVEANTLVAGIYTYTLIVDGNSADVKQMIITK